MSDREIMKKFEAVYHTYNLNRCPASKWKMDVFYQNEEAVSFFIAFRHGVRSVA